MSMMHTRGCFRIIFFKIFKWLSKIQNWKDHCELRWTVLCVGSALPKKKITIFSHISISSGPLSIGSLCHTVSEHIFVCINIASSLYCRRIRWLWWFTSGAKPMPPRLIIVFGFSSHIFALIPIDDVAECCKLNSESMDLMYTSLSG